MDDNTEYLVEQLKKALSEAGVLRWVYLPKSLVRELIKTLSPNSENDCQEKDSCPIIYDLPEKPRME